VDSADLAFAGVARQLDLLRSSELTSRQLTEGYLERIQRLDPLLNAFRSVYWERALAEADQADARIRAGDERPLLGVPLALKDNMDVAGDVTAYGTRSYGEPAAADSEVVRRLRAAGAIVLGKTHLPELAIFPITESASWGVTRNPWRLDRTTGGSSGGSAAAVAAGLAPAALGSDGGGSIRIPAACCHLFGLKPQRGRVSLAPHTDHWYGLTALGPLTRGVLDAALLLDAVAGPAPGDADPPPPPERPFADAARSAPRPLRIALALDPPLTARAHDAALRAARETAELLRALGHEVSEHKPDYGEIRPLFAPLWLRGVYDEAAALPATRQLERRTRQMIAAGRLVPPSLVERSLRAAGALRARLSKTFDSFDAVLTPALARPPVEAGRWEGRGALWTVLGVAAWTPYMPVWNLTGQPAVSVPAGFTDDGLPLAVQLVGRHNDEVTLLSLAAQIESERPWAGDRPDL
jgi:amidase